MRAVLPVMVQLSVAARRCASLGARGPCPFAQGGRLRSLAGATRRIGFPHPIDPVEPVGRRPAALGVLALLALLASTARAAPVSVTVPFTLDHNRILVDARLPLPGGDVVTVRAWVDNGNPDLWLTQRVAALLGLEPASGKPDGEILGARVRKVRPPRQVLIGGMSIPLTGMAEAVAVEASAVAPGSGADINIPSAALRHLDVVVDYVDRTLTLASPGHAAFAGSPGKAFVNPSNGLVQLPAAIDGEVHQLTLDVGACFSMLEADLLARLAREHPGWPGHTGAVGVEIFWGLPEEARQPALRVPSLRYGPLQLANVGFVAFPQDFIPYYRERVGAETSGLVGGDALLDYRVGIDFARALVYLERRAVTSRPAIDVVGLTLRPHLDGSYTVIGVPVHKGLPAAPRIKPGDVLLEVDGVPVQGATMGRVFGLLGGRPGEPRVLALDRDGRRLSVKAWVLRFLPAAVP